MKNQTGQEPDELEEDAFDDEHQAYHLAAYAVLMNEIMATVAFAIVVLFPYPVSVPHHSVPTRVETRSNLEKDE